MTTKQDDNTLKSLELSEGQLEVHFRRLNLAHMRRIYQEVAVRAEKESWWYRDFLALLLAEEVARRKQTRLQRCTRSAHFPFFKTIDEFDFTLQSTLRESVIGSYLGLDFVTEGRSLILHGKTGRGKTHLAVAIGYRAIQNGFETLFTTAAELIEDLSNASKRGHLQESLTTYTHPHVLVIDEVGYLTYGPDAANVLFHVVNDRHQNGSEFPELVAQNFRNPQGQMLKTETLNLRVSVEFKRRLIEEARRERRLTFGLPWTILAAFLAPSFGIAAFYILSYLVLRSAVYLTIGIWGLQDRVVRRNWWLAPVRDLANFAIWVASFFSNRITWRGLEFRVEKGQLIPLWKRSSEPALSSFALHLGNTDADRALVMGIDEMSELPGAAVEFSTARTDVAALSASESGAAGND
jgi:DNA replication protein DnaC